MIQNNMQHVHIDIAYLSIYRIYVPNLLQYLNTQSELTIEMLKKVKTRFLFLRLADRLLLKKI